MTRSVLTCSTMTINFVTNSIWYVSVIRMFDWISWFSNFFLLCFLSKRSQILLLGADNPSFSVSFKNLVTSQTLSCTLLFPSGCNVLLLCWPYDFNKTTGLLSRSKTLTKSGSFIFPTLNKMQSDSETKQTVVGIAEPRSQKKQSDWKESGTSKACLVVRL